MSRRRGYKRYSVEFKREALRRASEDGTTDKVVCGELGISARQLAHWRDELRLPGDDAFLGIGQTRSDEATRLKRSNSASIFWVGFHQEQSFNIRNMKWTSSDKRVHKHSSV